MGQGQYSVVHNPIPQPGEVGQHVHTVIAIGQFRYIRKIAQALVAANRVGMMVGMALEMKQSEVAHNVIGIPRMMGLAALVAAVFLFLTQQAIVLNIIGRRKLKPSPEVVYSQER